MKKSVILPGLLCALLSATGCHSFHLRGGAACHEARPYLKATSVAPLKIPPGLDTPDRTNALHIPALNEPPPPPRSAKDPCLEEPPPFKVAKQAPPQA
ncbi:MAG: hypothetical protein JOZ93_16375 [Sinobacteraceae bacterium]|nr:hypothetical protein [Nevskiaceae bacterium]